MDPNNQTSHPSMDWESRDLPTAFKRFKEHAEFMFKGPLASKSQAVQCSYLMLWVGDKGRQLYSTWNLSEADQKVLKCYYEKFEEYCRPKSNHIYSRYVFRSRVQNPDETFEQFVTDLRSLIQECGYIAEIQDMMIRDHIVFGITSNKIRQKLIAEGSDLTLQKAIDIAQTHELSMVHTSAISQPLTRDVDAVNRRPNNRGRARNRQSRGQREFRDRDHVDPRSRGPRARCGNCGNHGHATKSDCPAKGVECHKCGKLNHFQKVCKSERNVHDLTCQCVGASNNVCDVCDSCSDHEDKAFHLDTVSSDCFSIQPDQVFVKISIQKSNQEIECKVDTGSQINCIPNRLYKKLGFTFPVSPSDANLTTYSGERLRTLGKVQLDCSYKGNSTHADFYIVDTNAPPILGLRTSLDLNLIKLTYSLDNASDCHGLNKTQVLSEFKDVFEGIGLLPGTCSLHLKENAQPVVCPPRKVPFGLQDKLKAELDSMESKQIIAKVTEPTDWVSSLVCVEKPATGKLRIVIDPKILNENIRRPHYPMRSIDDITSKLAGAKYFSVLDATKGYWSVRLDKKSSLLTTFNTPHGRYRYLRLPMGIRSSQDIFQRKIDEIFEGLHGVTSIVDDILVFGRSKVEHDTNLRNVLFRARDTGLRFNPDKCIIGMSEVKYFGHIIGEDGLKPDPDKVSAILSMEIPRNRAELETFLGMVTYLTKFAPNLADITSPLRSLLLKDAEFKWDSIQTDSFNKVKTVMTESPILSFYDSTKPVRLQVDASSKGLGAVCLQEGKPIAYASKALTPTQMSYSQIEKEMLAVLFGCTRFKHYIYGRHTVVESDHKPLESIAKKPLCSAPPRLQRMLLQLQDYDLQILHCKGTNIPLGDALSRNHVTDTFPDMIVDLDTHVHTILKFVPISDNRLQQVRDATREDNQMQSLIRTIQNGWPDERKDCPKDIVEYWNHRDELSWSDDIVFRGQKLVIPKPLRPELVKAVHVGHFGIDKTTRRAKDIMFWPSMSKQITDYVLSCDICSRHRDSNVKEPLHPHEVPQRPWQCLSCDLFTWNGQEFMVTVDAYSRYFEFDLLRDTKTISIIRKLRIHFSRYGIPEKLKTDNAAYFMSEQFQRFLKSLSIHHETSSPTHASSNGLAEAYVKITKRILQKSKEDDRDPYMPLLEYRNTPLKCGWSPAQLLMGRRLNSTLPCSNSQLEPKSVNPKVVRESMLSLQTQSKQSYDKTARKLAPIKSGEQALLQRDKKWEPVKIISQHNEHSYNVQTADGAIYRRNRRYLNKIHTPLSDKYHIVTNQPCKCISNRIVSQKKDNSVSSNLATNRPKQSLANSKHVTTRSGRIVKPSKLTTGGEWRY